MNNALSNYKRLRYHWLTNGTLRNKVEIWKLQAYMAAIATNSLKVINLNTHLKKRPGPDVFSLALTATKNLCDRKPVNTLSTVYLMRYQGLSFLVSICFTLNVLHNLPRRQTTSLSSGLQWRLFICQAGRLARAKRASLHPTDRPPLQQPPPTPKSPCKL